MPFLCSQPLNNYLLICPQIILCAKHTFIAWWYMWTCCYLSVVIYCSSSAALFCTGSGKALERTDISTGSHLPGSTSQPSTTFLSCKPPGCHTETVLHKYWWNEWVQTPQKLIQEFHSSQFGFISTPQPGSALSVGSGVAWVSWGES